MKTQTCVHPATLMRTAIGPQSGILCGLCGQDMTAPLVFGALLGEIQRLQKDITQLERAAVGHSKCHRCGDLLLAEYMHPVARKTTCLDCFDRWLDSDDDDCETAIPEQARRSFAGWLIRIDTTRKPHILQKAKQAFPWLESAMRHRAM
jgi:ferredoxin